MEVTMAENNIGKITQIIGAVIDIKFTEGNLPEINSAINIKTNDGGRHGKMYRPWTNRWSC